MRTLLSAGYPPEFVMELPVTDGSVVCAFEEYLEFQKMQEQYMQEKMPGLDTGMNVPGQAANNWRNEARGKLTRARGKVK